MTDQPPKSASSFVTMSVRRPVRARVQRLVLIRAAEAGRTLEQSGVLAAALALAERYPEEHLQLINDLGDDL